MVFYLAGHSDYGRTSSAGERDLGVEMSPYLKLPKSNCCMLQSMHVQEDTVTIAVRIVLCKDVCRVETYVVWKSVRVSKLQRLRADHPLRLWKQDRQQARRSQRSQMAVSMKVSVKWSDVWSRTQEFRKVQLGS